MNRASSATGWVRNPDGTLGWTWNPLSGCLNHTPEGLCLGGMFPCYAFKLANGRLKQRYLANENIAPLLRIEGNRTYRLANERGIVLKESVLTDPFYPRFWKERLEQVTYYAKHPTHKGIFVCDMGELFGDWIPAGWQEQIFDVINAHPWHRFYLLTKQPQNLLKFSPFPDNCFVGVTVTTWDKLMEARFALHDIEAKVKYISFEPLLSEMRHLDCLELDINWLIIGTQTKPTVYPKISWVEEIVQAADRAGIPVFLKDNLAPALEVREPFIETTKSYTRYPRQELPHA